MNGKDILDLEQPGMKGALQLAEDLVMHCKEFNLSPNMIIAGVAWNAEAIQEEAIEKGYNRGIGYERGRVAGILGITDGKGL